MLFRSQSAIEVSNDHVQLNVGSIGVFGATPVAQPTTAGGSASFTVHTGTAINTGSTFDGYTLEQVVKALRDLGLLA